MPKFRFLSDADKSGVSFEAFGKTERELLQNSALALQEATVETRTIRTKESTPLSIRETSLGALLFSLLEQLIFLRKAKQLLFREVKLGFEKQGKSWILQGFAYGERIDESKHKLRIDIKAPSKELFKVEKTKNGFRSQVILEL